MVVDGETEVEGEEKGAMTGRTQLHIKGRQQGNHSNSAELSRIVVATSQNRPNIDRNRFVPVCGHRPGHFGIGFVRFLGRFGSNDFRPDS